MEWAALRGEALGGHLPRWRFSTMSRIACASRRLASASPEPRQNVNLFLREPLDAIHARI